jgi:outer membrane protein assembly factor BamD (BamD/ComL family)
MRRLPPRAAIVLLVLGLLPAVAFGNAAPPATPPAPTRPSAPSSPPAATTPATASGGAQEDDDRPLDQRTFSQGIEALRAGRRDEAARLLRHVFNDFPDSPQAPAALLKVAEMGYPVSSWAQVGSATPAAVQQATELLARLAQKYRASREASRALVLLGYLGLEPANPKGDLDEACSRFATAAQIYPDSESADDAYFGCGLCDLLRDRPARAADLLGRLIEEHPDSPMAPEALYRQGVALSLLGDPAEAMLALQRLRNRYPDSPLAQSALARITLLHRMRFAPLQGAPGAPAPATKGAAVAPARDPAAGLSYRLDPDYGTTLDNAAPPIRGVSDISIDAQGLAVIASPHTPGVFRLDARGRVQERITHPGPDHIAAAEGLAVYISGKQQIAVNARNWSGTDLKGADGRAPIDYGPIAVDALGRVYLLDRHENAVLIYDRTRRLAGAVHPPAGKEGRFVDVAAGDENGIFVLDGRSRTVLELHQGKETHRTDLGATGVTDPIALAVDGLGDLYILDGGSGAVLVVDPAGHRLATVRLPKETQARLGEATAVAVDPLGRIYLAGRRSGVVVRLQ